MEHVEPWAPDGIPIGELFVRRVEEDSYMVAIKNALHGNFCDLSHGKKYVKAEGVLGPIEGEKFLKIMNYYVLSFFNKYVKEIPDLTIEDLSTRYPEVVFRSWLKKNADKP